MQEMICHFPDSLQMLMKIFALHHSPYPLPPSLPHSPLVDFYYFNADNYADENVVLPHHPFLPPLSPPPLHFNLHLKQSLLMFLSLPLIWTSFFSVFQ